MIKRKYYRIAFTERDGKTGITEVRAVSANDAVAIAVKLRDEDGRSTRLTGNGSRWNSEYKQWNHISTVD